MPTFILMKYFKELWYFHTVDKDTAMKYEIDQPQKTNTVWFYLYELPRQVKLKAIESRIAAVGTRGNKKWGKGLMGAELQSGAMKRL